MAMIQFCNDCHRWGSNCRCPAVASACSIAKAESVIEGQLIEWLREKLTSAKTGLRSRQQMEQTLRSGSDADWKAAAANQGGPVMNKADRVRDADAQRRIARTYQRDIDMLELILSAVEKL